MGSSTMIVNIDPPRVLDETICKQTDFLIADAGYIGLRIYFYKTEL